MKGVMPSILSPFPAGMTHKLAIVFKTFHHIVEMIRYNAKFIKGTGPDAMSAVLLCIPGVYGEDMTFFRNDHVSIGSFTCKDGLSPDDLGRLKANPLVIEVFDYRTGRRL